MNARYNKYSAKKTEVDGVLFHSAAEARRYQYLKLLERAGEISNLELQPRYDLWVNHLLVATYVGDFRYIEGTCIIVEDVKGVKTPVYQLKKRLLKALLEIEIREVEA